MEKCGIHHGDIKPDNILVSKDHEEVNICDLGSASEIQDRETTEYGASRFYRGPEIIMGCEYGPPADMWSMACTLYELFTGQLLFKGKTNNDMLRLFLEVKGRMPNKMVKTGKFARKHFELDSGNFRVVDYLKYFKFKEDGGKKKYPIKEVLKDFPIKNALGELVLKRIAPERRKSEKFEDRQYVRKAKQ